MPLFEDQSAAIGLDFVHALTLEGKYPIYEITGAGMAVFDANGDGRLDLFCLNCGSVKKGVRDRLFLQGKDGKLTEVSENSEFAETFSTGCTVGDLDNDGDLDLYVGSVGTDRVYLNDGAGSFRDATAAFGNPNDGFTTSVGIIDFDQDGYLDIYAVRYCDLEGLDPVCSGATGKRDYCHPKSYTRADSVLLRNEGGKRFVDVSKKAGIAGRMTYGLGVISDDFNEDGWPDLYIANDSLANFLFINDKKGGFEEIALMSGAACNEQGAEESSMGLAVTDLNFDGHADIFTTNLLKETNTLYLGEGNAQFRDATAFAGLAASSLPYTGWGTAFFDPDNDGDSDLMVVNGAVSRAPKTHKGARKGSYWERYSEANLFYANDGEGRLRSAPAQAAPFCSWVANNRSMLAVDFDADGGEDVFANTISEETRFFRNVAANRGNWIKVDVFDPTLNRRAEGAVVLVYCGDRIIRRTVTATTSYLAATVAPLHFGIGDLEAVERIEVRFPGGDLQSFPGVRHGQTVKLERQRK